MNSVYKTSILLKEIESSIALYPEHNEIFILQGRLVGLGIEEEEIGFLLNELYKSGVIGIFEKDYFSYEPSKNSTDEIDDFMYKFKVNKEKLEKYQKEIIGNLKEEKAKFDSVRGIIKYLNQEILLMPGTNEKYVCEELFEYQPGFPVRWEGCYEKISSEPKGTEKEKRVVYDSVRRVNKRFKEIFKKIDLFSIKNNTITRNI